MTHIYISTRQSEETKIIVARGGKLINYEQEITGEENRKGDIYKGTISSIEESLDAAFVDLGADEERNGFLPLADIPPGCPGISPDGPAVGDSLLVQIKKEFTADSNKGVGLTGYISLVGSFLILNTASKLKNRKFAISAKISHHARQKVEALMESLELPDGMSVIMRSASAERSKEELQWDLNDYLIKLWEAIQTAGEQNPQPVLIYRENNMIPRVLRDYFFNEDSEFFCDNAETFAELRSLAALLYPGSLERIHFHDAADMVPEIIEQQIDKIFERRIATPMGVNIVFDSTEALVAVDVNSGRLNTRADIEATALAANLEAAELIAEQLRLRNLGGLVIIDFIDMEKEENRRTLEKQMFGYLKKDRARVNFTELSKFGIMELSRQRLARALISSQQSDCSVCNGTGQVLRPFAFAIRLLRKIRAQANQKNVAALQVQAPEAIAVYLLNEKRINIRQIEDDCNCSVIIVPNPNFQPPMFQIKVIKGREVMTDSNKMITQKKPPYKPSSGARSGRPKKDAVLQTLLPSNAAPSKGFFERVRDFFSSDDSKKKPPQKTGGGQRNRRGGRGDRPERAERGERGDRGNRRGGERGYRAERGDRGYRGERGGDRSERGNRGDRPPRRERGERGDRGYRGDRNGERHHRAGGERPQSDRTDRPDSGDERSDTPRTNSQNRGDRPDAPRTNSQNRGDRPDRGDRGDRGYRGERSDRGGDRNDRNGNRDSRPPRQGDRPDRGDRSNQRPAAATEATASTTAESQPDTPPSLTTDWLPTDSKPETTPSAKATDTPSASEATGTPLVSDWVGDTPTATPPPQSKSATAQSQPSAPSNPSAKSQPTSPAAETKPTTPAAEKKPSTFTQIETGNTP